jgi:DNA-binding NarL/FixJ family response regulator
MLQDAGGLEPRSRPEGSLVGREQELTVFEQALVRLTHGSSQVIEVTGDPGIGKTRLLAELGRLAAGRGVPVLDGRAQHGGERIPFYALVDALDDHVAGLSHGGDLDVLGTVFPSLSSSGRDAVTTGLERYRVFRAVRTLLESLASPGLVLLLDDLQWADEDTAGLLAQLLRHPPRRPVLLAFAYRWRQAPARLRAAATAGRGDYSPLCLRLGPLSAAEAEVMLAGQGSPMWRSDLYRASGGNPFYLDALARSGWQPRTRDANGDPAYGGLASERLPPAVTGALLAEVDALSPDGQLAVQSAAVIGDPFCVMSVGEVSGLDQERAAASVAELASADLIRPVDPTRLFSFRHALVRSVAYESANPAWRVDAHGRAAGALRDCGAPLTAQAHHIERAAEFGDLAAVSLLAEAASSVQAQAPGTAAQWLRAALHLCPEDAGPQRTTLLFRLAFALGAAGQPGESRDTLRAALHRPGAQRHDKRVEAVAFCAHMERQLGRYSEGQALLLAELSALPDRDTVPAAALKFQLGCTELAHGNHAAARRWAQDALVAIGQAAPAGLQAAVLGLLATADAACGDIPNAVTHLAGAAALLDGMLDGELEQCLDAAAWVGWGEFLLERPVPALRHLDRGLTLAHDNSQVLVVAPLLIGRALALRATGRLAQACTAADEAVEAALLSSSGEQQAAAQALRASLAAWTGDLEAARTAAGAAAGLLPGLSPGWLAALATRTLADARLAMGDAEGCLALAASGTGVGRPEVADWARVGWFELLTRAELAAGRPQAAARWAEAAADSARRANLPRRTGLALLAQAEGLTPADPRAAYALAVAAGDALSAEDMALDAARATLAGATALAACGDRDRACAEARAAQSALQSCGAAALARSAAGLGRRIAASGPGSREKIGTAGRGTTAMLTRRERQVACLVSEGLTNRGIAERLHVTDKTVEMHVSNIFAKLGVSTRTEAAATLIRAGQA